MLPNNDLTWGVIKIRTLQACTASAPGYQDGCRQRGRARASRGGASAGGATCLDDEVHALLCGHPLRALSSRALLERSEETGREGERAAAAEALGSAPGSRGCVTSGTPVIGLDAGSPPSPSPQGGACTAVSPMLPAAASPRAASTRPRSFACASVPHPRLALAWAGSIGDGRGFRDIGARLAFFRSGLQRYC